MEEEFVNKQVNIESLPSMRDIQLIQLERPYLKVRLWTTSIIFFILALPIAALFFFKWGDIPHWAKGLIAGVWCITALISFLVSYFGFFVKGYAVRDKDIVYQEGLIWRSKTIIPFNRVQHCEVSQGPIARMVDVAALEVYTAGGTNSDMGIPGLQPNVANRIKDYIIKQTAIDEEE